MTIFFRICSHFAESSLLISWEIYALSFAFVRQEAGYWPAVDTIAFFSLLCFANSLIFYYQSIIMQHYCATFPCANTQVSGFLRFSRWPPLMISVRSIHADIIELAVQELREKHKNNLHSLCYFLLCYPDVNNLPK